MRFQEASGSLLVCPECRYAFPASVAVDVALSCPREDCRHSWTIRSETHLAIHGTEQRVGCPELVVVGGASPFGLELPQGDTRIGTDAVCQCRLDSRTLSPVHAVVRRTDDLVSVQDNRSRHGTTLNGERIRQPVVLCARDLIGVGGATLRFDVRYEATDASPIPDEAVARIRQPRFHGKVARTITLKHGSMTIGRSPDCDLLLLDHRVSSKHAMLESSPGGTFLGDTASRFGTYVNGSPVIRVRLHSGDRIRIGPYRFHYDEDRLTLAGSPPQFGIVASRISRTAGSTILLAQVDLALMPGEFVGLLGPSGAGKTTLLNALNGMRLPDQGRVLINGSALPDHFDEFRKHIGYVPQDDIIHDALTPVQALHHAARLRLPRGTTKAECARRVNDVLATMGLTERQHVRVRELSGGQRKRVSVGVELLANPGILFLDEPTSGLDPATETHLMQLFRRLGEQGCTVVCTTHVMENVHLFHKVVVLAPGGRLAFVGPSGDVRQYFGIEHVTDLYDRIGDQRPEKWQQRFRQSGEYSTLRDDMQRAATVRELTDPASGSLSRMASPISQFGTLLRREWDLLTADRVGLGLLVLQPAAISSLILLTCDELPTLLFLFVITALWFGCSNAAQQIVREKPVYRRERMVVLRVEAYLAAKVIPLFLVGMIQCGIMVVLLMLFESDTGALKLLVPALTLSAWCGTAMGLIISALAKNADRAMAIVPLTLIPQIILAGVLVPLPQMNVATELMSWCVAARWSNVCAEVAILDGRRLDQQLVGDVGLNRVLRNRFPDTDFGSAESAVRFLQERNGEIFRQRAAFRVSMLALTLLTIGQLIVCAMLLMSQDTIRPGRIV